MIRVSTTTLEQFRRVIQTDYASEQELIEQISGKPFTATWQMEAGTAWHQAIQLEAHPLRRATCRRKTMKGNSYLLESVAKNAAQEMSEKFKTTIQEFACEVCGCWHIGRPTGMEGSPLRIDTGDYSFDWAAVEAARAHIGPGLWEVKATKVLDAWGCPVNVVAQADHVRGLTLQDNKTKFSQADARDYEHSIQWRFYLAVHEARCFQYNLFSFWEPDGTGACEMKDILSFRFWPYGGMEADCRRWLGQFLDWAHAHRLTEYLEREGSTPELAA